MNGDLQNYANNGGYNYDEEEVLQHKDQQLVDLENEEQELDEWIKELQNEL